MRNRETAVVNLSLLAVTPNEVVFIVKEERLLIFCLNAYAICSPSTPTASLKVLCFLMLLEMQMCIHAFINQFCDLLYQIWPYAPKNTCSLLAYMVL